MRQEHDGIADAVLAKIEDAGWDLKEEDVPTEKPAGKRIEPQDHPGLKLTASKGGELVSMVIVRDRSAERARFEAACMLAEYLDVAIAA